MSKIALSPNASGTGVFTIASPNGNTDRTLTLPDEAGTVLTSASSISRNQIAGGAGKVLQVQRVLLETEQTISTTTFTNITNASITITPVSPTSTMYIKGMVHAYIYGGTNWHSFILRVLRNSTDLGGYKLDDPYTQASYGAAESMDQPFLYRTDTLGSTTPVTYTMQGSSKNNLNSQINRYGYGYFEVMEIEA